MHNRFTLKGLCTPRALPATYQRIEYVEATGTQYCESGNYHTNDDIYFVEYMMTGRRQQYQKLFGASSTIYSNTDAIIYECNVYDDMLYARSIWHPNDGINFGTMSLNTKYFGTLSSTMAVLSTGSTIVNMSYYDGNVRDATMQDYIFSINGTETTAHAVQARIYSLMIRRNARITHEYVPCYRKADGEIGLYDVIENAFYPNIGSGIFLKGKDIK